MNYYIYKYIQNNQILYIGKTKNLTRRIYEHSEEPKFKILKNDYYIYYFQCNNEIEMNSFEYFLIIKYHPILNCTFNNINISNVFINDNNWQKFTDDKKINENSLFLKQQKERHKKEDFIPYDNKIMLESDDNFISIPDFCTIKNISKQSVYKTITTKKKWYKYIRLNPFTQKYEIHKIALNIPTQKELN